MNDKKKDPEDPKNHCPYCTHYVEKDATSCDGCRKYCHYKCLAKYHTWNGESIKFTPQFKKWLEEFSEKNEGQSYSFFCSKCKPEAPPLPMQLWKNKTLSSDVAYVLDIFEGPLEQYTLENPHDDTSLSRDPDEKGDSASRSGNSESGDSISQSGDSHPTMKMMEMMMQTLERQRREDRLEQQRKDERAERLQAEKDERAQATQTKLLEALLLKQPNVKLEGRRSEVTHLLPKLQIPTFSGKLTDWQSFWAAFSTCVDSNDDLPDSHKLQLLKSNLVGEAKNQIEGFSTTNAGYQKAKNHLLSTFGDKEAIVFEYMKILMNLPNSSDDFLKFFNEFNICIGNLLTLFDDNAETLKGNFNLSTFSIFGKLSLPIQERLLRENGSQIKSDILLLHSRLNHEAYIQRSLVKINEYSPGNSNRPRQPTKASGADLLDPEGSNQDPTKPKPCCFFCQGPHYHNNCSKFPTIAARKRQIGVDACTICLRKGHDPSHCTLPKDSPIRECWHCKKRNDHNQAFCPTRFQKSEPQQLTVEFDGHTDSPELELENSVEPNFLSPTDGTTAMPFFKAFIRKPGSNICVEVNAFLDTGESVHIYWTVLLINSD